jgi:hypothetical protein
MILKPLSSKPLEQGDIVVYFRNLDVSEGDANLGLIEELGEHFITVGPFGPLAGDDDEGFDLTNIPVAQAHLLLSYPVLEVGDVLFHRGRPACISETKQHDWHIKIVYSDTLGGEFYGNVIWMDFKPTLVKMKLH